MTYRNRISFCCSKYFERIVTSSLVIAAIGNPCIGLWAAAPLAGAQRHDSQTTKSTSARQGKTAPPRKATPRANSGLPLLGRPCPGFRLPDTEGRQHTLAEWKGKPIALYFFCGCERCQRCAQTWGQLQHGGALTTIPLPAGDTTTKAGSSPAPNTIVVFMGDAEAARSFAETNGLDMQQTLLLPDPKMDVTRTYHALPCPRAFALDAKQTVRYVNSHKDDDPLKASAATIVTRTLEALTNANTPNAVK